VALLRAFKYIYFVTHMYAQKVTLWYIGCDPYIHSSWLISHTKYSSWLTSLYVTKYLYLEAMHKGVRYHSRTMWTWVTNYTYESRNTCTLAGHAKRGYDEARTMNISVTKYIYVSREIYIFGRLCKKRARYESRTMWKSHTRCTWESQNVYTWVMNYAHINMHMSRGLCTDESQV